MVNLSSILSFFSNKTGSKLPFKLKRVYSSNDLPESKYRVGYWDVISLVDYDKLELIYKHFLSTKTFYYYVNRSHIEGIIYIKDRGLVYILISGGGLEFGIYKSGIRYDISNARLHHHPHLSELVDNLVDIISKEYNKDYNL